MYESCEEKAIFKKSKRYWLDEDIKFDLWSSTN